MSAGGLKAALGRMETSATDVCMILRSMPHPRVCNDADAENVALLRRHCERYTQAMEESLDGDVNPQSSHLSGSAPFPGASTVMPCSSGEGMSVHERMRHWWSTRVSAESEHALDDFVPGMCCHTREHAHVRQCNGGGPDIHTYDVGALCSTLAGCKRVVRACWHACCLVPTE